MAHMLSYLTGRLAREVMQATVQACGGSKSEANTAGLATQVAIGAIVGIVTLDIGGHALTIGDVAASSDSGGDGSNRMLASATSCSNGSSLYGGFYDTNPSSPNYTPPEDRV